jgi:RNA polymerase sigma factor (sigma-70 family)
LTHEEFKSCFNELFDAVRNYTFYRCNDGDLATDIAQEAFMKIWEKDFTYHPQKTKSLVYKIANELWISQYRKSKSVINYQLTLSPDDLNTENEHNLEYKELKDKYEATLSILPLSQREVFLMSRMEELTYKEIAERLDIGIKAVEKRMSLALKELRKALSYDEQ